MPSLSSKLRELRKKLKKNIKKGTVVVYEDEQLRAIARHMPRDVDSLKPFLSSAQMNTFGDDVLQITQTHTSRDQAKFEDCITEIGAFVRGGVPGMAKLDKVYPNILKHFNTTADMEEVFEALKLHVHPTQNKIKRKFVKDEDEEEEGPASQRMRYSSQ